MSALPDVICPEAVDEMTPEEVEACRAELEALVQRHQAAVIAQPGLTPAAREALQLYRAAVRDLDEFNQLAPVRVAESETSTRQLSLL